MTETLPPTATSPAPRARRRSAVRAPEAEVRALVERAAAVPDGLAVLEGAPPECAAVLLGVDPGAVERVRAALEDPTRRAAAARHHLRHTAGRRAAPRPAAAPAPAPAVRDTQALLLAALARDGGVALLLSAAPEVAAIAFGVHPALVHAAREAAGGRSARE